MNPNVYAVIVLGIGCETHQEHRIGDEIAKCGKPVETVSIQDHGGTLQMIAEVANIAVKMVQRELCDFSELIVGTQRGGRWTA